jgi:hypothetical protein
MVVEVHVIFRTRVGKDVHTFPYRWVLLHIITPPSPAPNGARRRHSETGGPARQPAQEPEFQSLNLAG